MENIKHWTDIYPRTLVEETYHKLTDKQWNILVQEVDDNDDDIPLTDVIDYLVKNIERFEQEHDLWNAKIA
jgi:hypothetical protein